MAIGEFPWWQSVSSSAVSVSGGASIGTTLTLPAQHVFFTWREAVMQAADIADRYNTIGKVRVHRVGDGWVVTYSYRPIAMNGAA